MRELQAIVVEDHSKLRLQILTQAWFHDQTPCGKPGFIWVGFVAILYPQVASIQEHPEDQSFIDKKAFPEVLTSLSPHFRMIWGCKIALVGGFNLSL